MAWVHNGSHATSVMSEASINIGPLAIEAIRCRGNIGEQVLEGGLGLL